MERQMKAFFYDYKYYLFPDDCMTLEELKKRDSVTVKRLKEENCMAPDFIYESIAEETLAIEEPDLLFEVYVNLYSGEEYDKILKEQIDRVCPGCERYIPDGDPRDTNPGGLDGHHREISLSGACYEREEANESWDFATCVDYFWYHIAEQSDRFKKYIDADNQKRLNTVFGEELSKFTVPVKVYGAVNDGKYSLTIAADYDHVPIVRVMFAFLAEAASDERNEMKKLGWTVFSCREKGVYKYTGKTKPEAVSARLVPCENPNCYNIEVYSSKPLEEKKAAELFQDVYDYLSEQLGEKIVQSVLSSYLVTADETDMRPVSELLPLMEEKYGVKEGKEGEYPASYFYTSAPKQDVAELPFRELITGGVTRCPEMSFLDYEEHKRAWWLDFFEFFYLYVPSAEEGVFEAVSFYLLNGGRVPEPLRDPEDTRVSGGIVGAAHCVDGELMIDCMVASEKAFFRKLRTIAPVLQAYGAKLVAVKSDSVSVYQCGYEFELIESHPIDD